VTTHYTKEERAAYQRAYRREQKWSRLYTKHVHPHRHDPRAWAEAFVRLQFMVEGRPIDETRVKAIAGDREAQLALGWSPMP